MADDNGTMSPPILPDKPIDTTAVGNDGNILQKFKTLMNVETRSNKKAKANNIVMWAGISFIAYMFFNSFKQKKSNY